MQPEARKHLRARSMLGKYRIVQKIADGGFARVYKARDTIEGIDVALKIPHDHLVTKQSMDWFKQEARVNASLEHPNILQVKNAELIDDRYLVIAYPLGQRSLAQRLRSRVGTGTLFDFIEQMLAAVAHAHSRGVVHCDLKPENFILFSGNRLRLADFGVARMARRTIRGSGSGTIGYLAPEHALGRTSARGDVFSLGLIFWSMLTGSLPEWPFAWPPRGIERIKGKAHADLVALLQRAMEVEPKKRFADAQQMLKAFQKIKPRLRRNLLERRRRRGAPDLVKAPGTRTRSDWKQVRFRDFTRQFRSALQIDRHCGHCEGPVSEAMHACPWCREELAFDAADTSFPDACPRCERGRKLDWKFCGWCYGKGFEMVSERHYSDKRYTGNCSSCEHPVMPFMRYCPGCRRRLERSWKIEGAQDDACGRCGQGVVLAFWDHCPWCRNALHREASR